MSIPVGRKLAGQYLRIGSYCVVQGFRNFLQFLLLLCHLLVHFFLLESRGLVVYELRSDYVVVRVKLLKILMI